MAGKIAKKIPAHVMVGWLAQGLSPCKLAEAATILTGVPVSRQTARYWIKQGPKHWGQQAIKELGGPKDPEMKLDLSEVPDGPVIVFLDIETAPTLAHTWRMFKAHIGNEQIQREWFILSFAVCGLAGDDVLYMDARGKEHGDDKELLDALWEILDDADIIVAQNGRKFDAKMINARLVLEGYPPPSPYTISDTLEVAKRRFRFTSNKLEWLSKHLSDIAKRKHGAFPGNELWEACLAGVEEAWEEMRLYNIDDILSLRQVWQKFIPWDDRSSNAVKYGESDGKPRCPRPGCGSTDIELYKKHGKQRYFYTPQVGVYPLYRCNCCKGFARGRKLSNTLESRRTLLTGV